MRVVQDGCRRGTGLDLAFIGCLLGMTWEGMDLLLLRSPADRISEVVAMWQALKGGGFGKLRWR